MIATIARVVQQHDVTRPRALESPPHALRFRERTPVDRAHVPEDDALTRAPRLVEHCGATATERRSEQPRRHAEHLRNRIAAAAYFGAGILFAHEPRMTMAVAVVADLVTGAARAPQQRT